MFREHFSWALNLQADIWSNTDNGVIISKSCLLMVLLLHAKHDYVGVSFHNNRQSILIYSTWVPEGKSSFQLMHISEKRLFNGMTTTTFPFPFYGSMY
jgi:hypothetical protein